MYKYYNANPFGRNVNDCSVRAISLATKSTWDQTYRDLANFSRMQGITFSEVEFIDELLADRYEMYCFDRGKSMKLRDFLDLQLPGRWLITMAGHITCVIDGVCYDTFDPSDKTIWCIYRVE